MSRSEYKNDGVVLGEFLNKYGEEFIVFKDDESAKRIQVTGCFNDHKKEYLDNTSFAFPDLM